MIKQSILPLSTSKPYLSFSYHQNIEKLDKRMKCALSRQDASGFAESCLELGLRTEDNPDLDLFNRGLMELDLARANSPKVSVSSNDPNCYDKDDKTPKRYDMLLRLTASYEVNPNDTFRDIDTKREILAKSGYNGLYTQKGKIIPLIDASDERVGFAYKRMYESAEKWKAKQKKDKK